MATGDGIDYQEPRYGAAILHVQYRLGPLAIDAREDAGHLLALSGSSLYSSSVLGVDDGLACVGLRLSLRISIKARFFRSCSSCSVLRRASSRAAISLRPGPARRQHALTDRSRCSGSSVVRSAAAHYFAASAICFALTPEFGRAESRCRHRSDPSAWPFGGRPSFWAGCSFDRCQ